MAALLADRTSLTCKYSQLDSEFDANQGVLWMWMNSFPIPCFTPILLAEISACHNSLRSSFALARGDHNAASELGYVVLGSRVDGVFSLGGNLSLFRRAIERADREQLLAYATSCIRVLHNSACNFGLPLTTIALVQGDALGGGFEAALASDVLIAEKGSQLGFPEILFNLFPGMGAYTLLSRRVGRGLAEKMMSNGRLYKAEELFELGIVNVLAEKGEGLVTVNSYIKKHQKHRNGLQAINALRQKYNSVSLDELLDITRSWVDCALRLTEKDLRVMDRLVSAQAKRQTQGKTEKRPVSLNVRVLDLAVASR